MNDYRSNWNEPFSPLGPAIKPKQEEPVCPVREFEEVSRDVVSGFGAFAGARGVDLADFGADLTFFWDGEKIIEANAPLTLHADGEHDDTEPLRAWLRGDLVHYADGSPVGATIEGRILRWDWMAVVFRADGGKKIERCALSHFHAPFDLEKARNWIATGVWQ
jgi:hypothetical protein